MPGLHGGIYMNFGIRHAECRYVFFCSFCCREKRFLVVLLSILLYNEGSVL